MRHFYQDGVNFYQNYKIYRKSDINEKTWQNNITIMSTIDKTNQIGHILTPFIVST